MNKYINKGSGIVLGISLFVFRFIFLVLFCPFSLQFAALWCHYCNSLEFEPLIFHGICNILVRKGFMSDGTRVHLALV